MNHIKFIFSFIVFYLFLFSFEINGNNHNNKEIKNCVKLSIKFCDTTKISYIKKLRKTCEVLVSHNQEIISIKNFYSCRRKDK